ncbi:MAG: hypothetical protein OR994_08225, partial [Candidatus Poseidoniales archaeon]|nr:hypothetical protein [Candidatus Poseidoniales archaeon]
MACKTRPFYEYESIQLKVRMHSGELRDMDRLPTRVDRSTEDFIRRKEFNLSLIDDLKSRIAEVKQGGGDKYVDRHRSRGKMLPRERIAEICDPSTPFLELSSLAANGLYDSRAHS